MKAFLLALAFAVTSHAADIVIMVVEDPNNYEAPRTMRDFAEKQLRPLGHQVTIIDGDKPQMHHFAGLVEALKDADLLVLFSRRRFPPKDQMDAIRAHQCLGHPGGDLDVLGAEFFVSGESFAWFERTSSQPLQFQKHVIDDASGPAIMLAWVPNLYGDGVQRALGTNHVNTAKNPPDPQAEAVIVLTPPADPRQHWTKSTISSGIQSVDFVLCCRECRQHQDRALIPISANMASGIDTILIR